METFSALLALCAGYSPVTGEFPSQMQVTRSFDVLFDLHLNKQLGKQSWGWWLGRHRAHYAVIVTEFLMQTMRGIGHLGYTIHEFTTSQKLISGAHQV